MLRKTFFLIALLLTCVSAQAEGKLKVVTTIPDLADIAKTIGGDRVEVTSLAKGRENIHAVRVKPSHIVATSKADVFIEMGLSMEHAWVPGLLSTSRNRKLQPGSDGLVNVSAGWTAREIPTSLSRSQGADLHPAGNPHFNLDPAGGRHIAKSIAAAFIRVDPASKAGYETRLAAYEKELDAAEARWKRIAKALAGKRVVTYHTEFNYLLAANGIELVATLEAKPGVPPTPRHIATVLKLMREKEVTVILTAKWSNNRNVEEVARKSGGARTVELPAMTAGAKNADTWIAMMDLVHTRLAEAFGVLLEKE